MNASEYSITDIIGTTFYTLDGDSSNGYYYSVFTQTDFRIGEADDPNDKNYELVDGAWVEDTNVDEIVYSYNVNSDATALTVTWVDEITGNITFVVSITEKTSDYWVMKYDIEYADSEGSIYKLYV